MVDINDIKNGDKIISPGTGSLCLTICGIHNDSVEIRDFFVNSNFSGSIPVSKLKYNDDYIPGFQGVLQDVSQLCKYVLVDRSDIKNYT